MTRALTRKLSLTGSARGEASALGRPMCRGCSLGLVAIRESAQGCAPNDGQPSLGGEPLVEGRARVGQPPGVAVAQGEQSGGDATLLEWPGILAERRVVSRRGLQEP